MTTSTIAVVFDLDGTLLNCKELVISATSMALENNGFRDVIYDDESYQHGKSYCLASKRLAWHATGNCDSPCGPALEVAFEKYAAELLDAEKVSLYPSIKGTIFKLSTKENITLGVVSNSSSTFVRGVLNTHKLGDAFKMVCCADVTPPVYSSAFNAMLLSFGVPPSNVIYVSNSPGNCLAAFRSNMRSIGVTWGNSSSSNFKHCEDVISSSEELLSAIDAVCDRTVFTQSDREEEGNQNAVPKRCVSWQADVIDNEHMNKLRTDDEYWDGR